MKDWHLMAKRIAATVWIAILLDGVPTITVDHDGVHFGVAVIA
jgi:hypothetical protein